MSTRGEAPGPKDRLHPIDEESTGPIGEDAEMFEKTLTFDEFPEAESAFDFDVFEQTEAEAAEAAEQRAAERALSREPTETKERDIVPRTYLPPGDVVVDTRPVGSMTVVTLRGRINEAFKGAELGQMLDGEVLFDLSEVDRVSSFGVRGWLQMMDNANITACYYYRCSEAIVNQITMMRNFAGPGLIHSLLAPYTCAHCGEEFGAVYESVPDREHLLGRSAQPVVCPQCSKPAEMADDPWAYFALDDHLLERVPDELQQVIDHMTSTQRVDPVEKFISEEETRIRFNAPVDGKLRLRRVFAGLEGRVVLDLMVTPEIDDEGMAKLLGALQDLDPEVREVSLEGATVALMKALIADPVDRVYFGSAFIQAFCPANGIRRPVLIELNRRRAALLDGRMPPVEAGWAEGPLEFADQDLLFEVVQRFEPPPEPEPMQSFQSTAPPAPTVQRSSGMGAALLPLLAATGTIALVAALVMIGGGMLFLGDNPFPGGAPASVTDAAPEVAPLPTAPVGPDDGWDGGTPLPPPWVEQGFVVEGDTYYVVGQATGASVEEAGEASRADAIHQLMLEVQSRLEGPAAAAIGESEVSNEVAAERFEAEVGAWVALTRTDSAIKQDRGQITVATRNSLASDAWERLLAYYDESHDFRGLTVVHRFPTQIGDQPVVVGAAESWFAGAAPGDPVVRIDGVSVTSVEQFREVSSKRWARLAGGRSMTVTVLHDGERVTLTYTKPTAAQPSPKPPALPMNQER